MKTAALILVATAVAVTPALAAKKKSHKVPKAGFSQGLEHHRSDRWRNSLNRQDVYSYDGRRIGADPDPNVRMRLRDEDAFFRNGGPGR